MRTIIVSLLAASTLIDSTEASFGRNLRHQGGNKYGHNFQSMGDKAKHEKAEHKHEKELKKKAHLKEELEKASVAPEIGGNNDYTHPQSAHLLHSKEQEKYDHPAQESLMTPEEIEKRNRAELKEKDVAAADKAERAQEVIQPPSRHGAVSEDKSRKLMVPLKWSKQEQEFITAMLFSFSGVFLTFVTILATCFLCRKKMNKPLINQESQFWSSFVEDKGEIHQLEQENKGKAPLTKKTNFGSMNNKRGDIELA